MRQCVLVILIKHGKSIFVSVRHPKHVPGRAGGGWVDSDDDTDDSDGEIHPQSKSTGSNVVDVEER